MHDEVDDQDRIKFTVARIAAEFGMSRPITYRYLEADVPIPARLVEDA